MSGTERVSVNGVEIDEEEIALEMQHHPAPTREEAHREAAVALVVRLLLLQEASRLGLAESKADDPARSPASGGGAEKAPDERAIERLLEREITLPSADEDACRRYYEQNRELFRSEELVEAAHILIPASPDDPAARAEARLRAVEIARRAVAAPGRFGELAMQYSACPSAADEGVLGQIGPGSTAPEFERRLSELAPGEITAEPVETRYGYHVIRLLHRSPGRQLPYELVRDRVAGYLTTRSWTQAVHQYLSLLAGRARIAGVAVDIAESPLVR